MVCRLGRLAVFGLLALTMLGCAEQAPERPVLPEPSASVPAGLQEVSRMESHPRDVKPDTVPTSDKSVSASSGDVKPANTPTDGNSEKSSASSNNQAKAMSDGKNVKSSDMSDGASDGSKTADKAGEDDYQTVKTTAITARGEFPWTLDAEKVQYSESNQRVRVSAIVWSLLDENDKPRLTVRGRAADVNVESQNVAFDGPVDATGSQGETMHVNRLVWDSARQKILGSHGVKVVRKGTVMTGESLVASPDLKQVEVSGNVHVSFIPTEDTQPESDSLDY